MSYSPSFPNKKILLNTMLQTWQVVEANDDLLMLILVRLPAKSIFRFRCVCKRWNCIISAPFFLQTFYNLRKQLALAHKMVAFIQETYKWHKRSPESMTIVPVSYDGGQKLFDNEIVHRKTYYFVNSSNGLILLQEGPYTVFILNPVLGRGYELNRSRELLFIYRPAMALVCEENMHDLVLNYKVVFATKHKMEHSYLTMHTFCSKTREWMISTPTATGSLNNDLLNKYSTPLVVEDIIHWFTDARLYLVVYYMGSNTIQLVELPSECRDNNSSRLARSSRDDDLWLCIHMAKSCCIRIWMISSILYDSYKSQSSTIPSVAWVLVHELKYCPPAFATPAPDLATHDSSAHKEEFQLKKCVCSSWWRGGRRRKVPPYVDYYITKHCEPQNNCYRYSPFMEALTLSSYSI